MRVIRASMTAGLLAAAGCIHIPAFSDGTDAQAADAARADADTGTGLACASNAECDSTLCDVPAGQCIAEDAILFASPDGPDAGTCPKTQPCSLAHASAVADATRHTIKLAPGDYAAHLVLLGKTLVIHGDGATIANQGLDPVFEVDAGARLRVVGAALTGSTGNGLVRCEAARAPTPILELARTTLDNTSTVLLASPCTLTIENSVVRTSSATAYSMLLIAPTVATIERTRLAGGGGLVALSNASVRITNSVLDDVGGASTDGTFVGGAFDVSFSTIVDSFVKCSAQGATALTLSSSILVNTRSGAPADTLQSAGACTSVSHNVVAPQASPLGGTNLVAMPKLKDVAADDFHLLSSSPAIDRGDPASTNAVDFDGTPRPQGSGRDSGAFEYKP